jgi:cytochrome c-type biogenesis protein CcmF
VQIISSLTKFNKNNRPAVREPGIYRGLWHDIYIAPAMNYDTVDFGAEITVYKDEQITKDLLALKFNDFKISGSPTRGMVIESSIEVKTQDGFEQEIKLELVNKDGVITGSTRVFENYDITLVGVNLKEDKIIVGIKDKLTAQQTLKADISVKPLINLVWLGVLLITLGGIVSLALRYSRK